MISKKKKIFSATLALLIFISLNVALYFNSLSFYRLSTGIDFYKNNLLFAQYVLNPLLCLIPACISYIIFKTSPIKSFFHWISRFPAYIRISVLTVLIVLVLRLLLKGHHVPAEFLALNMFALVIAIAWTFRGCKREHYFKKISLTNFHIKLLVIFGAWISAMLLLAFTVSFGWKGGGAIAALTIICTMILIAVTLVSLIVSKLAADKSITSE